MSEYQTRFADFIARKVQEYGDKFDPSDLNPNFVSAFNCAPKRRVRVKFPYNGPDDKPEIKWGYVGVTTGWKPIFLLISRLGQHCSSDTLGPNCQIVDWKDKR